LADSGVLVAAAVVAAELATVEGVGHK